MLQWLKRVLGGEHASDAEALYRLGEAEALRRNDRAAEALLRRAVEKNAGVPRYHFALGCVLQASGQAQAAIEAYRRALALDPALVPAMLNLGSLLQAGAARAPDVKAQLEEALGLFQA